ncbi:DUF3397 domain-containing protein [Halobacillus sp. B29]
MMEFLVFSLAAILTLPVPVLLIFYVFARKFKRHKWKAIHQTANFTAPIFILSVHVLLLVIFEQNFFAFIMIFLLILLGLSLIVQYRKDHDVQLKRAFKGFWRVSFLVFSLFYLGLTVYGLVDRLLG